VHQQLQFSLHLLKVCPTCKDKKCDNSGFCTGNSSSCPLMSLTNGEFQVFVSKYHLTRFHPSRPEFVDNKLACGSAFVLQFHVVFFSPVVQPVENPMFRCNVSQLAHPLNLSQACPDQSDTCVRSLVGDPQSLNSVGSTDFTTY